ncbi:hypothetical protein [Haladaptatus sp. R4]|uniref:hypothetical protein n=1 Tax=Haladaptatus sp. R4 TaxID=1679489 RepID=UPI0009EE530F|nr:hypothetical protein [Haladaptatus sp. R4]
MGEHSDNGDRNIEPDNESQSHMPSGHSAIGGLALHSDGFQLVPSETRFEADESNDWSFQIVTENGAAVAEFEEAHGEALHLIIIRRDLTHFQHLHPEISSEGRCRVEDFSLPVPGVYRAFVDAVIDGQSMTLGFDLFAPGTATVEERPDTSHHASCEGYEVELLTDTVTATEPTQLLFEVQRADGSVADLEPYLGARGHLVALREGDLAYLHVHPKETTSQPGCVEFDATFPTPGRYRLFLQVKPDGELISTAFDVRIDH